MLKYDLLVYMALLSVIAVVFVSAYVVKQTPDGSDLETRKIRFAAATFTGILILLVFTSVLYFVDGSGPGKEIFERVFTGLTPIAGGIIGYFFAVKT